MTVCGQKNEAHGKAQTERFKGNLTQLHYNTERRFIAMAIKWKLTITQKVRYTDTLVLYHGSLERVMQTVNMLESCYNTDTIQYKIESVPEDEEYDLDE